MALSANVWDKSFAREQLEDAKAEAMERGTRSGKLLLSKLSSWATGPSLCSNILQNLCLCRAGFQHLLFMWQYMRGSCTAELL